MAVPARLTHLPKPMLSYLRQACAGDWSRVVLDGPLSATVKNAPTVAEEILAQKLEAAQAKKESARQRLDAQRVVPPSPEAIQEAARLRVRTQRHEQPPPRPAAPTPAAVPALLHSARPASTPRRTPVTGAVAFASPASAPQDTEVGATRAAAPADRAVQFSQAVIDERQRGYALVERFRNGLPEDIPVVFHPDVLALWGVDLEVATSVVRTPQRVELDVTYKQRTYSVLRFVRGDVMAVLGMKDPSRPMAIAVYARTHEHDAQSTSSSAAVGGGTRRAAGLPTTPSQARRRLETLGCQVDWDEVSSAARVATVRWEHNELGHLTMERATREQVSSEYQRCVRRMEAMQRKQSA